MLSKDVTVFLCFFLNWFSYYFICCCKIIISFILFSSLFSVLCIQLLEEVWRSFFLVKNWFLFELLSSLNLFILWTYHTNLIDSCYNVAPSVVGVLSPSKFVLPFLSSIPHSVYNSLLSCFFSFFACLLPSFFASFFPCFLSSWILYLLSLNLFATFLRNDLLWKIGQKESNSRICTVYSDVRAAPCTEGEMQRQFMWSLRNIFLTQFYYILTDRIASIITILQHNSLSSSNVSSLLHLSSDSRMDLICSIFLIQQSVHTIPFHFWWHSCSFSVG